MRTGSLQQADRLLERFNSDLQVELLTAEAARELISAVVRIRRRADHALAQLTRKIDDVAELARVTGTSIGRAKETVDASKVMAAAPDLSEALKGGEISLEQATEIARAEDVAPGVAAGLVEVAKSRSFQALRDEARRIKLDAEQHRDLAERQHSSRRAASYSDEIGMVNIHLRLEPHVGMPLTARAEAEAHRLARQDAGETAEPFERLLADAYVLILAGGGKGRARRPELVVLVSHEVARRGWTEVREGEVCKIPGVGPISPQKAQEIARDAFINGVFYDGVDLRHFKRWSKHIPVEVATALELGEPPRFDGVRCVDCSAHFRTEFDHVWPRSARGPTSLPNLQPRCWPCHQQKTDRDRREGRLPSARAGARVRAGPA